MTKEEMISFPKTLKEIVRTDESLLNEAANLLKSDAINFKNNCLQVVSKILDYRNTEIEEYISSVLNHFPSNEAVDLSVPFTFYYADENSMDELGKMVMKIMDKAILYKKEGR